MKMLKWFVMLAVVSISVDLWAQCGTGGGCPVPAVEKKVEAEVEKKVEKKVEVAPKEEAKTEQTVCPIMGGKIVKEVFADHEGRRIYFCCKGCVGKFNKDPEKYIKIVDEQIKKDSAAAMDCKPGCKKKCCEGKAVEKEAVPKK